ncbi:MAG: hypothetical protein R3E90_02690 [Marinicella sp.]
MKQETVPKSEQTSLLDYRDWESITAILENNLSVIELIGHQTAKGEKLYKTKMAKKAKKLLNKLHRMACDSGYTSVKWSEGDFFAKFEKLKSVIAQQQVIINAATQTYAESYKKCSNMKIDYLFCALNMIKDITKAVGVLEDLYRPDISKRLAA